MELSELSKTVQGGGFTYSRLDCMGKQICSIGILEQYPHLRQIDLSNNSIQDVSPICKLPHVLSLTLASNPIASIEPWTPEDLRHLLFLDLSACKLKELPSLHMPALRRADFSKNEIATCQSFGGHGTLQSLQLSENKLESAVGLANMPMLEVLDLSQNSLSKLSGLEKLPCLKTLKASKNSFADLDGPWPAEMPKLTSLDIAANAFADVKAFAPLASLSELRQVEVAGSPLEEQEGVQIRLELLIFHGKLQAINGEEVPPEEKEEAKALNEKRIEEEEAERLRKEEEARLAAEAGEGEGEES
eukprot:TRINITY_DN92050_c0_g1_i1.p1 TRINITY_DN92050_c0_g1~~TRINITY_DN92050_c0_g1_i1.p1  ORF type:complete len:334 (+),score=100.54 TRINITY_DN92050_c0_g1_i1:94-1002(+)